MWIADNWKDYQVIDCSKGEKLERWGDYLLIRPDPQVIWDTPKKDRGWKRPNGHYHQQQRRRRMGIFRPAPAVVHLLWKLEIQFKTLQL